MKQMKITQEHEWIIMQDQEIGVVGITNYAQEQLGDIVFVELPETGKQFSQGDDVAVVESVKAASELKAPVSGEVIEVNQALDDEPETINGDPTGSGWMMKIKLSNPSELNDLMSEEDYQEFITK